MFSRSFVRINAEAANRGAEAGKPLKSPVFATSIRNHVRIGACVDEASIALSSETGRPWALARDHHYQISNRFAWAWKVCEPGVPVILVYLGFLECDAMARDGSVIRSAQEWEELVRSHSTAILPARMLEHGVAG